MKDIGNFYIGEPQTYGVDIFAGEPAKIIMTVYSATLGDKTAKKLAEKIADFFTEGRKTMPEAMNREWELSKLRDELNDLRDKIILALSRGESAEVLEACLALGEQLAAQETGAVSHIERTIPKGDR